MKSLSLIFFLLLSGLGMQCLSQQLPYYSQYMYSGYYINPAIAGSKEDIIPVMMTFRRQWAGLDDAPLTNTVCAHASLIKNMGLGAIFLDDRTWPLHQTGVQLTYAYHIQLNNDMKLGFGLGGMFYQHVLDKEHFIIKDINDNVIQGGREKVFSPDAIFGIYFRTNRFFSGFSSPQLLETNLKFTKYADLKMRMARHYFLYSGYKFMLNDHMELIPSLLFKYVSGAPFQYDINVRYDYKDKYWIGVSYRNKESIIGIAGFRTGSFGLGYSYDFTLTNIQKYSTGSHEVFVLFDVPMKGKKGVASFE